MTITRKRLCIALMEGAIEDIKKASRVESLSEIEQWGYVLRGKFDTDPDTVSLEEIERYYEMVMGLGVADVSNIRQYWREMAREMLYGPSELLFDGSHTFDGSQTFNGGSPLKPITCDGQETFDGESTFHGETT